MWFTHKIDIVRGLVGRDNNISVIFQKSSPLKVLDQWKPNLVWIITRVSSFKFVSGDAVHQPTWPLLLKIEHMVRFLQTALYWWVCQMLYKTSLPINNMYSINGQNQASELLWH
jgi:hypothetical protein